MAQTFPESLSSYPNNVDMRGGSTSDGIQSGADPAAVQSTAAALIRQRSHFDR